LIGWGGPRERCIFLYELAAVSAVYFQILCLPVAAGRFFVAGVVRE